MAPPRTMGTVENMPNANLPLMKIKTVDMTSADVAKTAPTILVF